MPSQISGSTSEQVAWFRAGAHEAGYFARGAYDNAVVLIEPPSLHTLEAPSVSHAREVGAYFNPFVHSERLHRCTSRSVLRSVLSRQAVNFQAFEATQQ